MYSGQADEITYLIVVVYYRSPIGNSFSVFEDGLFRPAVFHLVIDLLSSYVFGDLFYSFGKETIYRMMTTFETMMILATKLTVTAGLILIGTWTPVMITVTA